MSAKAERFLRLAYEIRSAGIQFGSVPGFQTGFMSLVAVGRRARYATGGGGGGFGDLGAAASVVLALIHSIASSFDFTWRIQF
jgi:hypothetical protein